jgi:hypothetical protein
MMIEMTEETYDESSKKNDAWRSCFSFVCYKCIYSLWLCYLAHPTHVAAEWWKARKKSNERFFFFDILCFTINDCLLKFVSIINLFLWELLPESSFVSWLATKKHMSSFANAVLSICTIENVFRRANNFNFQFSNRNVTFITEEKNPSRLLSPSKRGK